MRALEQLATAEGAGGPSALHSQTIQALAQQLDANLATAMALRKQEAAQGAVTSHYPYQYYSDTYSGKLIALGFAATL